MKTSTVMALIFGAGMTFGAWPLITKGSKLHYLPAGFALQIGTMITFVIFIALWKDKLDFARIFSLRTAWQLVALAVLAGLVNGIGQLCYQNLLASRAIELSRFAPIVLVIQAVVFTVGGWLFYHEAFTVKKLIGIATAAITVKLLMGK